MDDPNCTCPHPKESHLFGQVTRPYNRDTGRIVQCLAVSTTEGMSEPLVFEEIITPCTCRWLVIV